MDELIHFILENFWLLVLIFSLLSFKEFRAIGIALVLVQAIYGFSKWAYLVTLGVMAFFTFINNVKKDKG